MIQRIVARDPRKCTIIFQDDIFVFTKDKRIPAVARSASSRRKRRGDIPHDLQFICTNRIDA